MEEKEKIVIVSIVNVLLAIFMIFFISMSFINDINSGNGRLNFAVGFTWLILSFVLIGIGLIGITLKKYMKTQIIALIIFPILSFILFIGM